MKFFVFLSLAIVSASADVSQLWDENGYHYPKPAEPFVEAKEDAPGPLKVDYLPAAEPTEAPKEDPYAYNPPSCPGGGSGQYCCENGANNEYCCPNGGEGAYCCLNGAENEYCCENRGIGQYCCTNGADNEGCVLPTTTTTTTTTTAAPTTARYESFPPYEYLPPALRRFRLRRRL